MLINVLLKPLHGKTQIHHLDPSTPLSSLLPAHSPDLYLHSAGHTPALSADVRSLLPSASENTNWVNLEVRARLRGGKGGFGAMLRATGGKMSSKKASNNDSCRDLSGRRLSTIKEAKKMAELLDVQANFQKTKTEAARAKLEALERQLGISSSADALASGVSLAEENEDEDEAEGEEGPSGSGAATPTGAPTPVTRTKLTSEDLAQIAGKKHRFDDSEYLEQSREINENVRSAVSAALLKKRKKAKTTKTEAAVPTPAVTSS